MAEINITVDVTYRVKLSNVEVKDDIAKVLAQYVQKTIYDDDVDIDKNKTIAMEWIAEHIQEKDFCDYEATIEELTIDGEQY